MQPLQEKKPRLFAFDLDGTLLDDAKQLTAKTLGALGEMAAAKVEIVFASGRIASSIRQYTRLCPFPVAILSLNGAAVYRCNSNEDTPVFSAPLAAEYADFLIAYAEKQRLTLNYYLDNTLYAVQDEPNQPWLDLYYRETGSGYRFLPSLGRLRGNSPSKIIFIGPPELLDEQHRHFSTLWGDAVYICRTWDYYLEFLNPLANKGNGLARLADTCAITMDEVVAFGDAPNDIPMLEMAGTGIAVSNASPEVKAAANRVSAWSNNDDAVAREWEGFRPLFG